MCQAVAYLCTALMAVRLDDDCGLHAVLGTMMLLPKSKSTCLLSIVCAVLCVSDEAYTRVVEMMAWQLYHH
jgi:hypothetical protein